MTEKEPAMQALERTRSDAQDLESQLWAFLLSLRTCHLPCSTKADTSGYHKHPNIPKTQLAYELGVHEGLEWDLWEPREVTLKQ